MNDKKILIVDFDAESLIALSNLAYEEGFQAETATDGLSAYEKFRSGQFDLVILEPMLPKLHGFELCKKIVNDPERKVPVIIVTAIYREPQCRHDALTVNGASAFFTKPYNRDELRSKMLQLLVEGQDRAQKKVEAPAAPPVTLRAQAQAQAAFSPVNLRSYKLDLKDLLESKPVSRETRAAKPVVDIEKELQDAVAGLVGPAKKKEAGLLREPDITEVKQEFRQLREKRESKVHGDRDIDSLLKDAIGGLAAPPKKKRPEISVIDRVTAPSPDAPRREPAVKPVPSGRPESRSGQYEKVQVAEEIRQHLPFQPGKPNNIPRPASRAELGRAAVPYDIDRTLIEIDQIPLDDARSGREEKNAGPAFPGTNRQAIFEEFSEPATRKPKAALIGAVACVLIVAASSAFLVLKPKKPGPPPSDNVAAAGESLAAGAVMRPQDAKPYPDTAGAELKPEPKRAVAKPAPEPPVEIGAPIQPAVPSQETLAELQEQPAVNSPAPAENQPGTADPTESAAQQAPQLKSQETPPVSSAPPAGEPAVEKAREGALVALDQVDAAPVLAKRVEPRYPPIALRSGAAGTVTVNALISEKGDVLRTEILRGVKDGFGLEDAAETALRQWKFRPARKDGVNVKVWKSFDITFKPNLKTS